MIDGVVVHRRSSSVSSASYCAASADPETTTHRGIRRGRAAPAAAALQGRGANVAPQVGVGGVDGDHVRPGRRCDEDDGGRHQVDQRATGRRRGACRAHRPAPGLDRVRHSAAARTAPCGLVPSSGPGAGTCSLRQRPRPRRHLPSSTPRPGTGRIREPIRPCSRAPPGGARGQPGAGPVAVSRLDQALLDRGRAGQDRPMRAHDHRSRGPPAAAQRGAPDLHDRQRRARSGRADLSDLPMPHVRPAQPQRTMQPGSHASSAEKIRG